MITSEYNGFGLTYEEIVNSFNGAIESDFASNGEKGCYIIEREIEFQEQKLISYLNKATLDLLEEVPFYEAETVTLSGASAFIFPVVPDERFPIKVYVTSSDLDATCSNLKCGDFELEDDSSLLEPITVTEISGVTYGFLNRELELGESVFVSFRINKSELNLSSLKSILREMVCCVLGNALYSEGETSWGLVNRFCSHSESFKELLGTKRYLPSEFKRLKFVNPVLPGGLSSVPFYRV